MPGLRLRVADDAMTVLRLAGKELGQPDPPLPFWAFAWPGGLAIARYLQEHPAEVGGRRVIDLATGSGLCAIVALRVGAASVAAYDIDPLSEAAVTINARANGLAVPFFRRDPTTAPPPSCDVILAGDVCYEEPMARRVLPWLQAGHEAGARVLIGDPGRNYLPRDLQLLAEYEVHTTREIEDAEVKPAGVYTFPIGSSRG